MNLIINQDILFLKFYKIVIQSKETETNSIVGREEDG